MNSRPLVSVIMPVCNDRREYLDLAVESILRQTYDNFELLIMDDGSGPETAAALDAVARRDGRIRLLRQENAGLTKTLNRLIHQAQGTFIARQDADDLSEPDRLERQVSFLTCHPEVMLLGTGCLLIDEAGKILLHHQVKTRPNTLRRLLRRTNQFVHGSVMFRSDIFDKSMYNEEYRYAQDYEFFLRISERHVIANLNLPLYRYRINPASISVAKSREQIFMGMVVREMARRRRQGELIPQERIIHDLNTPRHRRRVERTFYLTQGRNLFLAGEKAEARRMFWRALAVCPSLRCLWHLLYSLMPGRQV
ncbi:MAG: glycosyltransferase [Deltaproteobacteria bacterium]|nr:MAG: glycosyltransferase [Deltaproteobacteria bacterium]